MQTIEGLVYLDHNASTPLLPSVREVLLRALDEGWANPSALHPPGRAARRFVDEARGQVAALLGCAGDEVVFTSGGTESNNLALRGAALLAGVPWLTLITSDLEHPATVEPAKVLQRQGATWRRLPTTPAGMFDVEAALQAIEALKGPALVSLILAQNETGVLQPVAEVARAARAKGALVHVDAAQAVGKIPVRPEALGVDLLSVAGHKLYAPRGVGVLYVRRDTRLAPLVVGAGQERGLRPGTENVAGIAALGEACVRTGADLEAEADRQRALRDELERRLVAAGFVIHGAEAPRLPNTTLCRFPGMEGASILARTPELAASTGSACHAGSQAPSPVLTAMGVPPEEARGAIRLSLGRGTTAAQVERAAGLLAAAAQRG